MYRVVLVDDEPIMLEGMRLMIDWAGCGFTLCGEAATAQEALRLLEACKPHLLITDVRMPGMLGTDLAVIASHYHPDTIVLFFSGYRDFSFAQSAIRARAFGYLVKPMARDEVHQALREIRNKLDERDRRNEGERLPVLRDHVLRRIAHGDTGEGSLLRAGALLGLQRGDPCYCAVGESLEKPLPESALLLLSGCGGTPFWLSPELCGVCFKAIEWDLPRLAGLRACLEEDLGLKAQVSVGRVGRDTEGFARSLGEALEARDILFECRNGLRLYRPADEAALAWLLSVPVEALAEALDADSPQILEARLRHVRDQADRIRPTLFALRLMAKTLETLLLLRSAHAEKPARTKDALHPLWASETLAEGPWLDAFAQALRDVHNAAEEPDAPAPVRAVLDAVQTAYDKPLSLGDIASVLGMNPAYLGQLVLRNIGRSFHTLLLDTRLSHACRLLRQPTLPISEIARAVGFREVEYFSRQFRRRMSLPPNAYRGAANGKEATGG